MDEVPLNFFLFEYGSYSIHITLAIDALCNVYFEGSCQHSGPIGVFECFLIRVGNSKLRV